MRAYHNNGQLFLEAVVNFNFLDVARLWMDFWHTGYGSQAGELLEQEGIGEYLSCCDHVVYDVALLTLMPDVLRPLPMPLTQAIRHFAKTLATALRDATVSCSAQLVDAKVVAVQEFCQALRRYTSLNHLAQAARALMQNEEQIDQMVNDMTRVDFNNVREQALWVCGGCNEERVRAFELEFQTNLEEHKGLEEWADWLQTVVRASVDEGDDAAAAMQEDTATEGGSDQGDAVHARAAQRARAFLLAWSFYSSLIIRDLTLRSAISFGSFHLLRLLFDEYTFFLVEQEIGV